jgi:hypothetical protein
MILFQIAEISTLQKLESYKPKLDSQDYIECSIPASPISAGPTLRPTLCKRCVVHHVSRRFNSR